MRVFVTKMTKLLEQSSLPLSSSAAYSSFSILSNASSRPTAALVSAGPVRAASSSWSSSADLSWGRMKTKRGKKAEILVPASMVVEERGSGKDSRAAVNTFRDQLISSFEQSQLCRENASGSAAVVDKPTSTAPTPLLDQEEDVVWLRMREEARKDSDAEPALASYLYSTILSHKSLERSLAFHLGNKLSSATFLSTQLVTVFIDTIMEDDSIRECIRADIIAVRERDPACVSYTHCLLNFKGFLALQSHRVAHRLWMQGRHALALAMQSRVSEVFHVDIHPGAVVGSGILFDHATGVVVGETAVIGNNVSILHHVTLGGTGAIAGDRHPKIGDGVLIGAGATILGPIKVGEGAKIGAGSVVLTDIPAHTTAVGNPARLLGGKKSPKESKDIPSATMDHTSFIYWSDYVI